MVAPAAAAVAGMAGSSLISGLLGMEQAKKQLAWEREKQAMAEAEAQKNRYYGIQQMQMNAPMQQAAGQTNVYNNLISALRGTI